MQQMNTSKFNSFFLIILLIIYLIFAYGIYVYYQDSSSAVIFFDSLQLIASLGAGILIMRKGLVQGPINFMVYTGYACLTWSLGQLFWLAYILVGRDGLPYPSVAELAFLGAYFFLITALKVRGSSENKGTSLLAWLVSIALVVITAAGIILTSTLSVFVGVYSIAYMFVVAWVLLIALSVPGLPLWLRGSVSLLCIADFLLLLQLLLDMEQNMFWSDPLYPLVFIILLLGVQRHNRWNNRRNNDG